MVEPSTVWIRPVRTDRGRTACRAAKRADLERLHPAAAPTVRECVRRMLRRPSAFVRAVAAKLARQKIHDTATVADVIAEAQARSLEPGTARYTGPRPRLC